MVDNKKPFAVNQPLQCKKLCSPSRLLGDKAFEKGGLLLLDITI